MSVAFPRTYTESWSDYTLLDAGGGKKLERFGRIVTIRPEVQAYFQSKMPFSEWNKLAHVEFTQKGTKNGSWKKIRPETPDSWTIQFEKLTFQLELTKFKHIGIFPEQVENWRFIKNNIKTGEKFLNLFAYTGAASLVAKSCGADVTHVDSVKQLVNWSKNNMELSNLNDIRWVLDDALKFAQREVKRGNKYQGIIMDPPAFGLGTKKEKWILEQQLPLLLETTAKLLEPTGFLILNTYSPKVDKQLISRLAHKYFPKKDISVSELWMNTKQENDLYFGDLLRVSS